MPITPGEPGSSHGQPADGDRIAGYRLVRVLGDGGMGVVWLAEQSEPVRREVALKVLKPGLDSKQIVARFEAERQALAVMEHPGIARVFDAGTTEAGRPFFVMERVDGVAITEYCDANRLGLRARVRLFAQVCRAVQHAHQKGVIHRDLKPSNVLAMVSDAEPVCKVIDFGIARAVEQTDEQATRLTQLGLSPGTPAYMSPEQVEGGLDIDTRSDIYSLGVLLYELLAGVLPFENRAYVGWALYAQHVARHAPVPSARFAGLDTAERERVAATRQADPASLQRQLRGDLDWIVMRALEKERDRRYETANGFAMDLERFLASEPVSAGPPGAAYRARKFVRRHRAGVAFAAVLAMLLIGFAGAMGVQAERVARARDLAVVRQGQAEGLIDFMLTDLRAKLEPVGRLDLLSDVGEQALAYFAALPEGQFSDDELLSRSQALAQIGQVRLDGGEAAAAIGPLRESLRLAAALSGRVPDDTRRLFQLGQSHFWVGFAAWRAGDLDAAEHEFLAYRDVARRLVDAEPEDLDFRLELGYAHSNLGSVYEARGQLPEAIEAYSATLAVKQELVHHDPTRISWLGELAETHNTLGVAHRKHGSYDRALAEHRRERELKRAALELDPTHAYWRWRLAVAHVFTANVELMIGRPESALMNFRHAAATVDSLIGHDPSNITWRRSGAIASRDVAISLAILGEHGPALESFRESERRLRELARLDPEAFDWELELGRSVTALALALALLESGDPAAALREADRAAEHLAAARGTGLAAQVTRAENDLVRAHIQTALGRGDQARAGYLGVLQRLDALSDGAANADLDPLRAQAYLGAGRTEEALRILRALDARGYRHPHLDRLRTAHGTPEGS
jgi:eukaryotic-like serine/threonine-protein kinase